MSVSVHSDKMQSWVWTVGRASGVQEQRKRGKRWGGKIIRMTSYREKRNSVLYTRLSNEHECTTGDGRHSHVHAHTHTHTHTRWRHTHTSARRAHRKSAWSFASSYQHAQSQQVRVFIAWADAAPLTSGGNTHGVCRRMIGTPSARSVRRDTPWHELETSWHIHSLYRRTICRRSIFRWRVRRYACRGRRGGGDSSNVLNTTLLDPPCSSRRGVHPSLCGCCQVRFSRRCSIRSATWLQATLRGEN